MLFNSYVFLFAFLPVTFFGYFVLQRTGRMAIPRIWLVACSLFFYAWWEPAYLYILLFSVAFNYILGRYLSKPAASGRRGLLTLTAGIVVNVLLLGYYKYAGFVAENINSLLDTGLSVREAPLPLAISFFTFQQIAYLVDSRKRKVREHSFLNYGMFVTFFPQLIAGPIVHHSEMMPQFADRSKWRMNADNIAEGGFVFLNGLFKKVVIADTLAVWVAQGFDQSTALGFSEAWFTSFAYTFRLYFDFSGYTDMALGLALLFNIRLPFNFNAPYKARDIQDFWRRWHITLSRFLRDYLYIPFGGNRSTEPHTVRNLMLTFLIGGLWHGAGWTFVFWGFLHGVAMVFHRAWKLKGGNMPPAVAWGVTFLFVNFAWVFFRARSFGDASKVLSGMFLPGTTDHPFSMPALGAKGVAWLLLAGLLGVVLLVPNTNTLRERFRANIYFLLVAVVFGVSGILFLEELSQFIYFGF